MASAQMIQELKDFFLQVLVESMEKFLNPKKEKLSGQKKEEEEKGSAYLVEIKQREDEFLKLEICTLEVEKGKEVIEQSGGELLKMEFSIRKSEIMMKELAPQADGLQRGLTWTTGIKVEKGGEIWRDLINTGKPTWREKVWILKKLKEFAGKGNIPRCQKDWKGKKKKENEELCIV